MSKSLARAFTNRRVKGALGADTKPRLNIGSKDSPVDLRAKISGPLNLVHTTNMLSYNAPDIPRSIATPKSSGSLMRSDDESDGARTTASSPPTSPDVPQEGVCPSPAEPESEPESEANNQLSSYFVVPVPMTPSSESSSRPSTAQSKHRPAIPRRAPSRNKTTTTTSPETAAAVPRSRSVSNRSVSETSRDTVSTKASLVFSSRASPASTSTSTSSEPRSPHEPFTAKPATSKPSTSRPSSRPSSSKSSAFSAPRVATSQQRQAQFTAAVTASPVDLASHPFGQELAQVTELAEEYGLKGRLDVADDEEREMARRGLCKFSAEVYLGEVDGLFQRFLGGARPPSPGRRVDLMPDEVRRWI